MVILSYKYLFDHSLGALTVLMLVGRALGFLVLRQIGGGGSWGAKNTAASPPWTQLPESKVIARGLPPIIVLLCGVSAIISTGESILS